MPDWLTWPADALLYAGGFVASWIVSKDASEFIVIQVMIATLVLAAVAATAVYWQSFIGFWKSAWKSHYRGAPGRGKADITFCGAHVRFILVAKRTLM